MLDPEVMIVDARSWDGLGKPLAQDLEIEPLLGIEPGGDEARNGQFREVEPSAEPGLKKLFRLRLRVGPHPSNAGHSARAPGNRGFGHEWRLAVLGAPPSGNAEGQTHGRLNLAHS